MSHWEEPPGLTRDTLERLYLLAGLGTPLYSPGQTGGGGWGAGRLGFSAWGVAPLTRAPYKQKKMDGWMDTRKG